MCKSQHYIFGHMVLRDLFFDDPLRFVANISNEFLQKIWDYAGNHADCSIKRASGSLKYTFLTSEQEDNLSILCIINPKPERHLETYFVGLILQSRRAQMDNGEYIYSIFPSYITLERGEMTSSFTPTAICEWSRDEHKIIGLSTSNEFDAFEKILQALASQDSKEGCSDFPLATVENYLHCLDSSVINNFQHDKVQHDASELVVGSLILHAKFGKGSVTRFYGEGDNRKIIVLFKKHGEKVLLLRSAGLIILEDNAFPANSYDDLSMFDNKKNELIVKQKFGSGLCLVVNEANKYGGGEEPFEENNPNVLMNDDWGNSCDDADGADWSEFISPSAEVILEDEEDEDEELEEMERREAEADYALAAYLDWLETAEGKEYLLNEQSIDDFIESLEWLEDLTNYHNELAEATFCDLEEISKDILMLNCIPDAYLRHGKNEYTSINNDYDQF